MNEASIDEKVNMMVWEDTVHNVLRLKAVRDIIRGDPIVTCYCTRTKDSSRKDEYVRNYTHHCSKSKCKLLKEKLNSCHK